MRRQYGTRAATPACLRVQNTHWFLRSEKHTEVKKTTTEGAGAGNKWCDRDKTKVQDKWTTAKAQRDNSQLEREHAVERDRSEEAVVDGNGSVVETLAQDWSPLDREMQHECADSHQGTSALLGWSRGQNGPLEDLREGFEMSGTSVVEMETAPLERSGARQRRRTAPKAVQNLQMGGIWYQRRDRGQWRQFTKLVKKPDLDVVIVKTQRSCTSCHTQRAGGKNSTAGFEWRRMEAVASSGGYKWYTENDEMERE